MIRVAFLLASVCVALAVAGVSISGCRPKSESDATVSAADRPLAQSTPEESFRRVADTIRRSIDTDASGTPAGFLYHDQGGHSSLSIRNEVTDKLVPPSKEGEPYRGTITVTSHFSYSMRISPADSGGEKSEGSSQDKSGADQGGLTDESEDEGVEILDSDLLAAAKKSDSQPPTQPEEVVARRSDEDVRNYELAYENNRWVLKTELDPKTEQSIQYAFQHALEVQ
jgi:hypothetical protein